jgi:hypothetical protein
LVGDGTGGAQFCGPVGFLVFAACREERVDGFGAACGVGPPFLFACCDDVGDLVEEPVDVVEVALASVCLVAAVGFATVAASASGDVVGSCPVVCHVTPP